MGCATCHVIIGKQFFDKLPEASEAEEDCLDNATGLSETFVLAILSFIFRSRLGCQVKITEDLEGMDVLFIMSINIIGDNSWNNTKLLCGWPCSKTSLVCLIKT